jgi:acyl-CoA reductase-like NAD-dependent aldehyde dehydrogenase
MRLYGKSLTSSIDGRSSYTVRVSHGVTGLIVPANTPIANIAWKIFPSLICGNTIVLKSSEDAPELANKIAEIGLRSGIPDGVFNVIHGDRNTGIHLVENEKVKLISFTGSTLAGIDIASRASQRLARVSLELGGKNPFIVCDDADLDNAVHWAILSAYSNAGQRCAAASRLIVFKNIYESFLDLFLQKASKLKLGLSNTADLGPVINKKTI